MSDSQKIKHYVAVASGKGGVGKSTVAANLALALSQQGHKVGLVDADIYGPSVPTLFGLKKQQPAVDPERKKILPLEKFGLKIMSIGFLIPEVDAVVWRGPMIHKMLSQFLNEVDWGELDYLIFDLPPGTGDVQISLSQLIPLSGAVVVTTPQDVAVADVVRAIAMFQKVNIPLIGIIENMSYFSCPHCEKRTEIFSHGGGQRLADQFKTAFLGSIPLDPMMREGSDFGTPVVVQAPGSAPANLFKQIAERVVKEVSQVNQASPQVNM